MKLKIKRPDQDLVEVEGAEARAILRETFRKVSHSILIPEMPFTGIVRCRMKDTLRAGRPISDSMDEHGHPNGTLILMAPKVVGIIHADGTYEKVGDGPETNPFEKAE
jgi:hypothetical protein